MTSDAGGHAPRPGNRILARLPEPEYRRLAPHLCAVELPTGRTLYEARGRVDHAYFSTGAVASVVVAMADGATIESASVGIEGVVGHLATLGDLAASHRVVVRIAGGAMRIDARALRDEARRGGPLAEILTAYHAAYQAQLAQAAACNVLHRLQSRCCRWLLAARDRAGRDDLPLTHEHLSVVLGARRAGVTDALRPLREAGLVSSRRGRIRVLDAGGLEARSCECYRAVRDEYDRLLGPAPAPPAPGLGPVPPAVMPAVTPST